MMHRWRSMTVCDSFFKSVDSFEKRICFAGRKSPAGFDCVTKQPAFSGVSRFNECQWCLVAF